MPVLHTGSARWAVLRQTNGAITWSIVGDRDGATPHVFARGTARGEREAMIQIAAALGAFTLGLRRTPV